MQVYICFMTHSDGDYSISVYDTFAGAVNHLLEFCASYFEYEAIGFKDAQNYLWNCHTVDADIVVRVVHTEGGNE